jgi:hypothetical protein
METGGQFEVIKGSDIGRLASSPGTKIVKLHNLTTSSFRWNMSIDPCSLGCQ